MQSGITDRTSLLCSSNVDTGNIKRSAEHLHTCQSSRKRSLGCCSRVSVQSVWTSLPCSSNKDTEITFHRTYPCMCQSFWNGLWGCSYTMGIQPWTSLLCSNSLHWWSSKASFFYTSLLQAISGAMCLLVVPQAPQHCRSFERQAICRLATNSEMWYMKQSCLCVCRLDKSLFLSDPLWRKKHTQLIRQQLKTHQNTME